ncbi:MAG: hypothetical protein KatS3mg008_0271 [Acidimicrobiales bacterium]|nr:MAG: hypothetical protein KatS3mg008_0271 [Acidimicrobiales bacterium]
MQGGCSRPEANCGPIATAELAAYFVIASNPRPYVVTFNEVCSPQYARLLELIAPLGYVGKFIVTNPQASQKCLQHGNALFILGAATNIRPIEVTFKSQVSGGDTRKLYCMSADTFFGIHVGCVTHLDPGGDTVTRKQNAEARSAANGYMPGYPKVIGGDLNLSPASSVVPWSGYREVDPSLLPTFSSDSPRVKIDWVQGDSEHHRSAVRLPRVCLPKDDDPGSDDPGSDHCTVSGDFYP